MQAIYGNQNWHTSYRGVAPEYFDIKRWFVDQGAIFSQDDLDRSADVCLIGRTVREQFFGAEDPIGKVMSGGQQQRVAIAPALVNRPAILLADEPTGNLDSRTSVEIMEILQNLNDQGLTILVRHEDDIAQFAKRVLVFRDGRIRKDDPVLNRPKAVEVLKTLPTLEDEYTPTVKRT